MTSPFNGLPVKSGKAEKQHQHGIVDVEAVRYERQHTHRAHDLTERERGTLLQLVLAESLTFLQF